jgi:ABC-type Mn2+/Zn2+ transport system ATPase subunit
VLALEVSDLTVQFEGQDRPAVESVSFTLEEGRIAVLIGPNGSGKSTVLRAILGLVPHRGTVRVFGGPVGASYPKIGYVPQRLTFDQTLPLTVREAIRMPLPRRPRDADEESFRHVAEILGIESILDKPLGTLSGGQWKRSLMARALVTRPRLLLLDEPEAGVDVTGEQTIYGLLEHLVTEERITALICSHELELVTEYADVVLCLNRRLLGSGAPKKVLTPEAIASLFGATPALYLHHHELHRGRHEPPQGGSP